MKTAPYIFAILFIGTVFYIGYNHFELPTFFLLDKTEKTKGTVTNTEWTFSVKGYYLQRVTYEYVVNDSVYNDNIKAGQQEGAQKVGDKILIEYSVDKPEKNKVIGYYGNKSEPTKAIKLESK
jgi:hypothetical protein